MAKPKTYVRRTASDTWHFVRECSNYPQANDVVAREFDDRPTYGELCNECLAKERSAS